MLVAPRCPSCVAATYMRFGCVIAARYPRLIPQALVSYSFLPDCTKVSIACFFLPVLGTSNLAQEASFHHTTPHTTTMSSTHRDSKSDIEMTPVKVEEGGMASSLSTNDDEYVTPTEEAVDESKYISGAKLYAINTALIVSIFIVQMESSIISTAVVDITDQLGGYEKSSWLFTAYLLTYCGKYWEGSTAQWLTRIEGLQMIWAKLSDISGRKYVLLASLVIFTLFSGLCGAAQTMDQLIMFRWCQGIGGCGTYALVQLIFLELVPRRKLPAYMALVVGALSISMVVGPLLGGGITLHGSWRWIFLIKYV